MTECNSCLFQARTRGPWAKYCFISPACPATVRTEIEGRAGCVK